MSRQVGASRVDTPAARSLCAFGAAPEQARCTHPACPAPHTPGQRYSLTARSFLCSLRANPISHRRMEAAMLDARKLARILANRDRVRQGRTTTVTLVYNKPEGTIYQAANVVWQ